MHREIDTQPAKSCLNTRSAHIFHIQSVLKIFRFLFGSDRCPQGSDAIQPHVGESFPETPVSSAVFSYLNIVFCVCNITDTGVILQTVRLQDVLFMGVVSMLSCYY